MTPAEKKRAIVAEAMKRVEAEIEAKAEAIAASAAVELAPYLSDTFRVLVLGTVIHKLTAWAAELDPEAMDEARAMNRAAFERPLPLPPEYEPWKDEDE